MFVRIICFLILANRNNSYLTFKYISALHLKHTTYKYSFQIRFFFIVYRFSVLVAVTICFEKHKFIHISYSFAQNVKRAFCQRNRWRTSKPVVGWINCQVTMQKNSLDWHYPQWWGTPLTPTKVAVSFFYCKL